jgi:hypothetical protein
MDEDERLKRQNFIHHLREREARAPRYQASEHDMRDRRMREREAAERRENESEAVDAWLVQRQCMDDLKRGESARVASAATRVEPELTEDFDWRWVDKRIAQRLREERAYSEQRLADFEQRLTELNDAVVENARAIGDAFDAVDRALAKAGAKANKELTNSLERMSRQLSENQHQIMRAINNKIDGKPVDEPPQSARRGVH